MKYYYSILLFFFSFNLFSQKIEISTPLNFVALGDSYTIGESVDYYSNWPNQLITRLEQSGIEINKFEIIAKTGWRTDNLIRAIENENLDNDFNLVSLLIGVNNQFVGVDIQTYVTEFKEVLGTAIKLARGDRSKVFVLSIPDYAYTPFGGGSVVTSSEIDQYNEINKTITEMFQVIYINITDISRLGLEQPLLIAADGLHPSANMYSLWVDEILNFLDISDYHSTITNIHKLDSSKVKYLNNNRIIEIQDNITNGVFRVFNIMGGLLIQQQVNSFQTLNLDQLDSGIYIYQIENNNQIIQTKKVFVH